MILKIKKIIRYAYQSLAILISLLVFCYLLLIILLEYLTYNPQHVVNYIKDNIQEVSVPNIKITRKNHRLNLNLYNIKVSKDLSIPKAKLKLNVMQTIWNQTLVFDNLIISKINLNLDKILNNDKKLDISEDSENSEKLKNLSIKDNNELFFKTYVNPQLKNLKFFKKIIINHLRIHWDEYDLFINYLQKTNNDHTFKAPYANLLVNDKTINISGLTFDFNYKNLDLIVKGKLDNSYKYTEIKAAFPNNTAKIWVNNIGVKTTKKIIGNTFNKEISNWINKAFIKGNIKSCEINFGKNTISSHLELTNTTVNYLDNWPHFKKVNGTIDYNNQNLKFKINSGKINNYNILNLNGAIRNIDPNKTNVLEINANLKGSSQEIIDYLYQIEYSLVDKNLLKTVKISGNSNLNFKLIQNLDASAKNNIKGSIFLTDNNLKINNDTTQIENLTGELNFDNKSFESSNLNFNLINNPINLKFNISQLKPGFYKGLVNYKTKLDIGSLQKFNIIKTQPYEYFFKKLSGSTTFFGKLELNIFKNKITDLKYDLNSNLIGLNSNLLSPFDKKTESNKTFKVSIYKNKDDTKQLNLVFDDLVFNLQENKSKTYYGKLVLPNLSFNNVLKFQELLNNDIFSSQGVTNDYHIKLFLNNTQNIQDFRLLGTLSSVNNKTSILIDNLQIFTDLKNLIANFDNFKDYSQVNSNSPKSSNAAIDSIAIKKLYLNNFLMGQMNFDYNDITQNLSLIGPLLNLEVTKKNSQIVGNILVPDIGKFLEVSGNDKIIDKAKVELSFGFEEINTPKMHGALFLLLKNGVIGKIEPGIGRLLGAFSLDTWQRRLKLDFSDLTDKSYVFDSILGNMTFFRNTLWTKNLMISGPSADVAISGNFDIFKDYCNLNVDVTPKISGGVPVAAAIASGNPAIGAVVWALDKLLQSPFNKINRTRYAITGSTQNLEINKIKTG